MNKNILNTLVTIFFLMFTLNIHNVYAAKQKKKTPAYSPIQSSLIVDAKTGKVLHAQNHDKLVYPASLTKVMTLYLLFEAIDSGKVKMEDGFRVSKHASEAHPLKLHLKPGEVIKVKDVIPALIVKSANDAARATAEALAGSEENFARLMTKRARQLGMKNTTFANASGLPDPKQKTTAVDLAKLAIAVKRDFPHYYQYFSLTSFEFKGNTINGHNRITAHYPGAEGLKTGFINASGCNIITTASRSNKSLIGVVTGGRTAKERDRKMTSLLDHHFGDVKPKQQLIASKQNKKSSNKKRNSRKVAMAG